MTSQRQTMPRTKAPVDLMATYGRLKRLLPPLGGGCILTIFGVIVTANGWQRA
jgi:hypothetical protein